MPTERLTPINTIGPHSLIWGPMGFHVVVTFKAFGTIFPWCSISFRGNEAPMIPRGFSLYMVVVETPDNWTLGANFLRLFEKLFGRHKNFLWCLPSLCLCVCLCLYIIYSVMKKYTHERNLFINLVKLNSFWKRLITIRIRYHRLTKLGNDWKRFLSARAQYRYTGQSIARCDAC